MANDLKLDIITALELNESNLSLCNESNDIQLTIICEIRSKLLQGTLILFISYFSLLFICLTSFLHLYHHLLSYYLFNKALNKANNFFESNLELLTTISQLKRELSNQQTNFIQTEEVFYLFLS